MTPEPNRNRESRYFCYVEGSEYCCKDGHATRTEAAKHALQKMAERAKVVKR